MQKLFVYGTLKRGFPLNAFQEIHLNQKFIDTGRTKDKFYMYKSTLFPYVSNVKINPDDTNSYITGEVYYIPDESLSRLDKIEVGYHREIIDIYTENSGIIKAYMYITNAPSGKLIQNGEFTRNVEEEVWR